MAFKVLGNVAPAATTETDMYTVPGDRETLSSTLSICNRSATSTTYRISIRPGGAVLDNSHRIAYDQPIAGNESLFLTIGLTLAGTDVVTVYGGTDQLTFMLFGDEK